MGLVDKLTEADEKIWKQYEKITQYCNKEYGWNKYDLASKASLGTAISHLSGSVYMLIDGLQTSNMFFTTLGIAGSLLSIPSYYFSKKDYERNEAAEIRRFESGGALPSSVSKPYRPLNFAVAAEFFSVTGGYMFSDFPQSSEEHNTLWMLISLAFGSYFICHPSESYFSDQIMTPPKKKKKVLKTLYEKVTGKFQAAPVPQSEPNKYLFVDEAVE